VNGAGKPVVAIDIDGTLGDYHGNFVAFARLYFDRTCDDWATPNPGMPMWEWMGIEKRDYRDAKLAYRQGGWKRWMPAYHGAAALTEAIRSFGAEVWLCTTRPYLRLDNVDPDTREWLRRNEIQYDALLFDPVVEEESKYHELIRQVGAERIAAVVEDLPEMMLILEYLRIPNHNWPILRDQPYNRHLVYATRVAKSMNEIATMVGQDLDRWYERNSSGI
jgi:hypothetical protein